jgi:hypothetical protein
MGDAIRDDASLAAARAGQDQYRALGSFDSLALLRIKLIQKRQNLLSIK